MANQNALNIRIDHQDKKDFETFCNATGLNVSVAITLFIKTVIREQRLPFEIKVDPFYSSANINRLRESIRQMEATGGTIHELSVDE